METIIEYFENKDDALNFAYCMDCAKFLINNNITEWDDIIYGLYKKFKAYTITNLPDDKIRRKIFMTYIEDQYEEKRPCLN